MTWTKDPITGKWGNAGPFDFRPPGLRPWQSIAEQIRPPAENLELDQKQADALWREILRITWREVMNGKRVTWPDVGTFTLTHWAGRPKIAGTTNPAQRWPDRYRVTFRLSRKIFAFLNKLPR
jgi:nucleoid DNA-binding protein